MKVYTLTYDTETEFGTELHEHAEDLWLSSASWARKVVGNTRASELATQAMTSDHDLIGEANAILKAVEEEAEVWAIFRIQEFEL